MKVHTTERNYSCYIDNCSKKFKNSLNLRNHLKIHNKFKKKFWCNKCNKEFTKYNSLKMHFEFHNYITNKTNNNNICIKEDLSKNNKIVNSKEIINEDLSNSNNVIINQNVNYSLGNFNLIKNNDINNKTHDYKTYLLNLDICNYKNKTSYYNSIIDSSNNNYNSNIINICCTNSRIYCVNEYKSLYDKTYNLFENSNFNYKDILNYLVIVKLNALLVFNSNCISNFNSFNYKYTNNFNEYNFGNTFNSEEFKQCIVFLINSLSESFNMLNNVLNDYNFYVLEYFAIFNCKNLLQLNKYNNSKFFTLNDKTTSNINNKTSLSNVEEFVNIVDYSNELLKFEKYVIHTILCNISSLKSFTIINNFVCLKHQYENILKSIIIVTHKKINMLNKKWENIISNLNKYAINISQNTKS